MYHHLSIFAVGRRVNNILGIHGLTHETLLKACGNKKECCLGPCLLHISIKRKKKKEKNNNNIKLSNLRDYSCGYFQGSQVREYHISTSFSGLFS